MKTLGVLERGALVREDGRDGLERPAAVGALVGFLGHPRFGGGDDFHLGRPRHPGFDRRPPAEQGVVLPHELVDGPRGHQPEGILLGRPQDLGRHGEAADVLREVGFAGGLGHQGVEAVHLVLGEPVGRVLDLVLVDAGLLQQGRDLEVRVPAVQVLDVGLGQATVVERLRGSMPGRFPVWADVFVFYHDSGDFESRSTRPGARARRRERFRPAGAAPRALP